MNLGCQEAMVVHGVDGLDEISTIGKTAIAWLKNGEVNHKVLSPKDFGLRTANPRNIKGMAPKESAETTFRIINGYIGVEKFKLDIALVNAAAGIIIGGKADSFDEGIQLSHEYSA